MRQEGFLYKINLDINLQDCDEYLMINLLQHQNMEL